MFPSLVNCSTIDWFTNWPSEALINVGKGSVSDPDADLRLEGDEDACVEMFKIIHQSVEEKVEEFKQTMRRITYVTPTSYLELLSSYKKLLKAQRTKVEKGINRLSRGLEVLKTASEEVDKLQKQLEENAPILAQTQIQVEETKKIIAEKTTKAEAVKSVVVVEEEEASRQAAEVKEIKDKADTELNQALPELEVAVKKVEAIDPGAFYSLKAIKKPSPSCVAVFKICCMFLLPNDKPPKQKGDAAESDPEGYWALSLQKFLSSPKDFLKSLVNYDRDNIPDALIKKVVPLVEQDVMSEERIKNASKDLLPVRVWVKAMIKYHEVLKIVNPMRETARVMKEKLDVVLSALAEKQRMVREINEELDGLNAEGARLVAQAKKTQRRYRRLQQKTRPCRKDDRWSRRRKSKMDRNSR